MAQAAGQRAAKIGDAEPLDTVIGAQLEPDDRVLGVRVFREPGERLVIRQQYDAGFERGEFHEALLARLGSGRSSSNRIRGRGRALSASPIRRSAAPALL